MIKLQDISQRELREFSSIAHGIMLVPSHIFHNFIKGESKDFALQSAVISGINMAKRTSDMFALCHSLEIQSVEIEITPSENILLRGEMMSNEFVPSFKPKKFKTKGLGLESSGGTSLDSIKLNCSEKIEQDSKIQDSKMEETKQRFESAKKKFVNVQKLHINHLVDAKRVQSDRCGFITQVCVKTLSRVRPDIESLNALNAAHLSLFNILNTREARIVEIRLER